MSCEKSPRACEWHPLPATVASRPCLLVGGKHGRDMPAGLEQVAHYSPFSCLQRGKLWPLPLPINLPPPQDQYAVFRRALQLVEMLFSPTLVPTNAECLVRSKPQSERRRRCSGFPFLPKSLTAPLRK